MNPVRKLTRMAEKTGPSRSPSFIAAHVLKALEIISSALAVGRQQLSRELGLGEGATRTLIRRLKDAGFIEISRGGMELTAKGTEMLHNISEMIRFAELNDTGITVGRNNYAVLVKGSSEDVRSGVEQRDSALLAGALGATTLVYVNGHLRIPGMSVDVPTPLEEELVSKLKPTEGDALIIGTSNTSLMAELGAKAAAIELIDKSI